MGDRALRVVVVGLVVCTAACKSASPGGSGPHVDSGSTAGMDGSSFTDGSRVTDGSSVVDDASLSDDGSATDDGSVVDVSAVVDLGPVVPVGALPTAPGAATCPADHPVLCATQCCAAGTTCADGGVPGVDAGSCIALPSAPVCPADAPVTCSAAPTTSADGGVIAYDESGHGVHARLLAPAAFGEGRASPALELPAAWPDGCRRDVATAPSLDLVAGDRPHSIEAWVRSPLTGGNAGPGSGAGSIQLQGIAGFGGAGLGGSLLTTSTTSRFLFGMLNVDSSLSFNGCQGGTLTSGAWHHVVGVYAGSGSTSLYVNGALVGTCTQTALSLPARPEVVFANALAAPDCAPFSGQIDEVRIVARALSAAEISADFAAVHHTVTADTLGLWRFDEGATVRCCTAGSSCDPGGGCSAAAGSGAPACPAGAPVSCGNGSCCPAGTSCGAAGCVVASAPAACAAAAPVSCGVGTCCPTGATCSAGKCIKSPTVTPGAVCGDGKVTAPDVGTFGTSAYACCPSTKPGEAVSFDITRCAGVPLTRVCMIRSSGANCQGGCATGYTCCPVDATTSDCVATPGTFGSCAGAVCGGGCCGAGLTCGGSGMCCPSGETTCGAGCCPAAQCVNGSCGPVPPTVCDAGRTLCGGTCCPSGSSCLNGECVAAAPVGVFCANGSPCGSVCCPALTVCARPGVCAQPPKGAACGAGFSGACSAVGPCCRDGFVCKGSIRNAAGFSCVATGAAVPHGGFAGPACGGGFCATGATCGGATCCAADHPTACGTSCCLTGATCPGGNTCGCSPAFPVVCGNSCCADGFGCFDGLCAPSCPGPNGTKVPTCGGRCCADGTACVAGTCVAPSGGGDGGSGGSGGGNCSVTRAECCSGGASLCGVPPATCDGCPTNTIKGVICSAGSPCNTMGGITAGYRICHCQ